VTQRDDFSRPTKKRLAEFANYRCCICDTATTGPGSDGPVRTHRAAHISGAAPGGPRYRAELSREERAGFENGLHLCANHADIVDDDEPTFTEVRLREIRDAHYARVGEEQQGVRLPDAFASSTTDILRHWPTTIAGQWLPRAELDAVAEQLADTEGKGVVVLGAPGSGKSALLAKLVTVLEARDITVFGLRLDSLPRAVASQADFGRWAGVSSTIPARLHREAAHRDVVLIVDQLDQLSELVDRDTRRLETVLACLAEAVSHPGVRIVCACREFDFNHDARFRRLAGECVRLPSLMLEDVQQVLAASGVDTARLPPALMEVLRVPQQLKVFVELLESRDDLLGPYHQMLEHVWTARVATPARSFAASRLATLVADHETAFVPLARCDDVRAALDELVREGVAVVRGLAVGFTHQTIFDFARARAFVAEQGDLETYVLQHQQSVFLRPVLWNALQYMRASQAPQYMEVLPRLLDGGRIRDHVRTLVAEFLGQLREPDHDERELVGRVLDDAVLRRTFLPAIGAGSRWFDCLGSERVRRLMRAYGTQLLPLLRAALQEHEDDVLQLVIDCGWIEHDESAPGATYLLRLVTDWTEAATRLLRLGISGGKIEGHDLGGFLEGVGKSSPDLAVELLLEEMQAALVRENSGAGERQRERAAMALAADALADERGLAVAAPGAVLSLLSVLPALLRPEAEGRQRSSHFRWPWALAYPDDEMLVLYTVLGAASVALAARPQALLKAAARFRDVDCDSVQAVLARGFAALPASHIDDAVQFVVEDPRRLCIAGRGFPDLVSIELLEQLGPKLSLAHVAKLEAAIETSVVYNASEGDVEQRRYRLKNEIERRSGLLMTLPRRHLSRRSLEHLSSFPAERPKPDEPQVFGFSPVPGPMSADQMGRARDAHLLNLFEELTDDTGREHPRLRMRGGSVEAARALKELSKRDPARIARLVASLKPGLHERPVGYALGGRWETSRATR